jgi:hypothetical protein
MATRDILSFRLAGLVAARNCGRRTYAAAAEAVARKEPVSVAVRKAEQAPRKVECSWIRDPKTGCWMPENHIDAADLHARLLYSKNE